MTALCYADTFVTERTDDVSEVLIERSAELRIVCNGMGTISSI